MSERQVVKFGWVHSEGRYVIAIFKDIMVKTVLSLGFFLNCFLTDREITADS